MPALTCSRVGPVVLAMKNAAVNGFVAAIDENASFLILSALHQQGVTLKAPLLSVAYGADLTSAGPGHGASRLGTMFHRVSGADPVCGTARIAHRQMQSRSRHRQPGRNASRSSSP
jgi:hypothetical protein